MLFVLRAAALLALPVTALGGPISWTGEVWSGGDSCPDLATDPILGEAHLALLDGGRARWVRMSATGAVLDEASKPAWGGEGNECTYSPGVSAWGGDVALAFKSELGSWHYDQKVARFSGSWQAPVVLAADQERGYMAQSALDGSGATVVFGRVSGETPYGRTNLWRLDAGVVDASSDFDVRLDDRMDLIAGPGDGERHMFIGYPNPTGHVQYVWSGDAGATWQDRGHVQAAACGGRVGQADAALAPDGRVHLVYGCAEDADRGGTPSVRHAVLSGATVQSDQAITDTGELQSWHMSHGIARLAVTDAGHVAVGYLIHADGALKVRTSINGGVTWTGSEHIADLGGSAEGRNVPALTAVGDIVFLAWGDDSEVHLWRGVLVDEAGGDTDDPDTGTDDPGDTGGTGGDGEPWAEDTGVDLPGRDSGDLEVVDYPGACGCSSSGAGTWGLALGLAAMVIRRRPTT